MSKKTLASRSKYSVKRISGFLTRMGTQAGQKILSKRRRKGRKRLT